MATDAVLLLAKGASCMVTVGEHETLHEQLSLILYRRTSFRRSGGPRWQMRRRC